MSLTIQSDCTRERIPLHIKHRSCEGLEEFPVRLADGNVQWWLERGKLRLHSLLLRGSFGFQKNASKAN